MRRLAKLSLANRALIALITLAIAFFGVVTLNSLKQELIPSISLPQVSVMTTYQGASPEIVDADISAKVETALQGLQGLESTTTTSSAGRSVVTAKFSYGTDLVYAEQRIQQAVNRIRSDLPDDVDPTVLSGSFDDLPVVQLGATGGDETELAEHLHNYVVPKLRELDGVRGVTITGDQPDRISIKPRDSDMVENAVAIADITDALENAGVLIPAGQLTEGDNTLTVQAGNLVNDAADLGKIALKPDRLDPTKLITLADVADVELEPSPKTTVSRVNGEDALTISVTKRPAANTVEVSDAVAELLPELNTLIPDGAKLEVVTDQAPFITQSIDTLVTEGLLGLAFAVLVIFVFLLSVRATLVTAISIPTSLLVTFIAMRFADYSLNILTLGALTIAIGRVVDDSIVVVENIRRHLQLHPTAALRPAERARVVGGAVGEVATAITASTIATVAVYLPIVFVADVTGELFRPFALTSTIAMLASLIVSLTIVPVLAYWFLAGGRVRAAAQAPAAAQAQKIGKHAAEAEDARDEAASEDEPTNWLQHAYAPALRFAIRRPALLLIAAALVLGGTVAVAPLMKTNFLGSTGQESFSIRQTPPANASLANMGEYAERLENEIKQVDGIKTVQLNYGDDELASMLGMSSGNIRWVIGTEPDANPDAIEQELRDRVNKRDDLGEVAVGVEAGGFSDGLAVRVSAPERGQLDDVVKAASSAIESVDSVQSVHSGLDETRPFIRMDIDRAAAMQYGLNEVAVGGMVAQALQPLPIGSVTMDGTQVRMYIVNDAEPPTSVDELRNLELQLGFGSIPLHELADIEVVDGPVAITAASGTPYTTLEIASSSDNLGALSGEIERALADADLPDGATAEIDGSAADQRTAFQQLGLALLGAVLIVYIVMVATFGSLLQPLLLLISVPFAATGAILLQVVTGIPLGVASLIGVLMLIGIVVTNAIVLVDLVNQYRGKGMDVDGATFAGASRRVRPIVMTALATVLALTPMGLGITGHGGFISQPMAVVVIGGLLSSTLLTLLVLPALYVAVERPLARRAARRAERNEQRIAAAGIEPDASTVE
ncbi:efflux RND transporter permease subunit [Gulosibacter hominis]|uniref:efflux RND transporter permease subunit n=1 Tax=Gulosibacter hominis TaxID=2770504 RepID=UPI00191866B9|nr:efflux RND transporter permease subunit [Gulosibacter hominis]